MSLRLKKSAKTVERKVRSQRQITWLLQNMLEEKPGKAPLKQSIEPCVRIDCLKNSVTKEKIKKICRDFICVNAFSTKLKY